MKNMKNTFHYSINPPLPAVPNNGLTWVQKGLQWLILPILFLLLSQSDAAAQGCALNCKQNLQVSLGADCQDTITYDIMTSCPGPATNYVVGIMRPTGLQVPAIITSADINQTLTVKVKRLSDGNECWGTIRVEDKLAPRLTCPPNTSFFCGSIPTTSNVAGIGTGAPVVAECSTFTLTFSDVNLSSNCLAPDTLYRTFIATDFYGNVASCLQKIALIRPVINNALVYVDNDTLYGCAAGQNTEPIVTGYPQVIIQNAAGVNIDTVELRTGNICNINVQKTDVTDTLCSSKTKKILRTWTILDACTGTWVIKPQFIFVRDTTPPTIAMSGPDTIFVNTNSYVCGANVTIPPVSVFDSCAAPVSVTATIYTPTCCNNPANIVGTVPISTTPVTVPFTVPVDTHYVVYRATDLCGNFSTRSKVIIVRDLTPPVAICRTNTVVSLTSDAFSRVLATTFDEGSTDNCCIGHFQVRRMVGETDADFKPYIDFTCLDARSSCTAPTPIQVILRVFDCNGNFNTCMINVTVQDKVPPTITAPPSVTVDCGSYTFGANLTNGYLATNFGKVVIAPTVPSQVLVNIFGDATNNNVFVGLDGTATDNCSVEVMPTFVNNLNNCGIGTIVRTWTARDPCGLTATATQTITVQNSTPFYINDLTSGNLDPNDGVIWPADYTATINNCNEVNVNTNPNITGRPTIFEDGCDQVLSTYSDEIFNMVGTTGTQSICYKILRTWVVVDWCQANIPGRTYRWTYSQAIKVIDLTKPAFTNCPTAEIRADILNAGCTKDVLTLPTPTATDCPGQVLNYTVTTNFPAGTAGIDNNPYTFFNVPSGVYTVQYSVEDNCGNVAVCNFTVRVEDRKKPTPVCFVSTTTFMQPPACMVTLTTHQINNYSYDNCTPSNLLRYRLELAIRGNPNPTFNPNLPVSSTNVRCLAPTVVPPSTNPITLDTFVNIFSCDLQPGALAKVRMYVIDAAGNFDFCETDIIISNFNGCPGSQAGNTTAAIAGIIKTEEGSDVGQVTVNVDNMTPVTTTNDGSFLFNVAQNSNYTVTPQKTMTPLNGISTLDLVLMSRHILGFDLLTSPYKIIAADVNKSGSVSTLDIVELRKLILHINDSFINNTSWRFVDKNFVFPTPSNPFETVFPETHSFVGTDSNNQANFVGIKIGDVNASATTNALTGTEEHNTTGTLNFNITDQSLTAGTTHTVEVRAKDLRNTQGFQFTLNFDAAALTLTDVKSGELQGLTADNFGLTTAQNGIITSSWNGNASNVNDETVLFRLTFRANSNVLLSNVISINSRFVTAEAYTLQSELLDVNLQFNNKEGNSVAANNFELYQNQPNPFSSKTSIGFNLPAAGDATLTIMDAAGRILKTWSGSFAKGYNELNVNKMELNTTGILYYQLNTATSTATKKMIIIE